MTKMKFKLIKKDGEARLGEIESKYGTFKTPMFMPVGTRATVKTLSPEELYDVGSGIVLANTYHLWLQKACQTHPRSAFPALSPKDLPIHYLLTSE